MERMVCLRVLDMIWQEHLSYMDHIRDSVRLRAYGGRDPLVEYKNEGHRLTNLTNGGEGFLNTKLSEEHRRNISKNHADVSGEKNPMYGRKHTEEVKQLSRELNTGKVASIETRLKLSEKTKGEKNGNSTLTENDIYLIREYFNDKKFTQVELSLMFNVKQPAIYKIINRLTWKHIK